MASHVVVIDSAFRRTQVKVAPTTYMRQVLEEACRSRKLNVDEHTLRTPGNKAVDMSTPFRLSGLSAGAKLQLTQASKSPGVVTVAVQLPAGENGEARRLSDKFPSLTSLWMVLRKCEDAAVGGEAGSKLNLTQRGVPVEGQVAGRLMYEQPCLNIMGRSLETFEDLQKTLAQLGLNGGSVLLRLSYRTSDLPLETAMQQISAFFAHSSEEPSSAEGPTDTAPGPASVSETTEEKGAPAYESAGRITEGNSSFAGPEPAQPAEQSETARPTAMGSQPLDPPPEPSPPYAVNRISVYRPPSSSTPAAALAPDDPTVFEPTIDHAKAHQSALQRDAKNKRLPSDKELAEREATRQQDLSLVQSVTVRVRYPDQSQIETTISASDTATRLYAQVADTLSAVPHEPFELRYVGARGAHETLPHASTQRLVRDFGFRGKILVTLVWGDKASAQARQGPSLKEEYRSRATELKVELASRQTDAGSPAHQTEAQKASEASAGGATGGKGKGDLEAKMKRFLGFGKK